MAYLLSTNVAFPPYYFSQKELTEAFIDNMDISQLNPKIIRRLHEAVTVKGRHLAAPPKDILTSSSFTKRNQMWIEVALDIGRRCIEGLLQNSSLKAENISQLIFTTVTGLAIPSIDARLMNVIPFSSSLKRVPLFGLGCVAGAAGIARAADYLKGNPLDAVILLCIELCSLTFQKTDSSIANFVSTGLFGDGAACVLMVGEEHPLALKGPKIIANQSVFFKDTEYIMGWDIGETGFKIVLSTDVPKIAKQELPRAVQNFLSSQKLKLSDIDVWICHPGGPKVLDAIEAGFGLDSSALKISRESLVNIGNMSSASVIAILHQTLLEKQFTPNTYGLLLAMGPGFCTEMVLLKW